MAYYPKQPTFLMVKELPGPTSKPRTNIKTTNDIFSYIHLQCKLLKEQKIAAKQTENMFTGTSADQQRKDASAARYPAHPNLHAIADSSPQPDPMLVSDPLAVEITLPPDEEYSYQDEAEAIASTSYDNDEVMEDFNSSLRLLQ